MKSTTGRIQEEASPDQGLEVSPGRQGTHGRLTPPGRAARLLKPKQFLYFGAHAFFHTPMFFSHLEVCYLPRLFVTYLDDFFFSRNPQLECRI